jgi:hypothetical protein
LCHDVPQQRSILDRGRLGPYGNTCMVHFDAKPRGVARGRRLPCHRALQPRSIRETGAGAGECRDRRRTPGNGAHPGSASAPVSRSGGRRRAGTDGDWRSISGEAWTILCFDVGSTKTAIVEGTENAFIHQRREFPSEVERPFSETFLWFDVMELALTESAWAAHVARPLRVSVVGPPGIEAGQLLNPPPLPGWHNRGLKDRVAARFHPLPVVVKYAGNARVLAGLRGSGRRPAVTPSGSTGK